MHQSLHRRTVLSSLWGKWFANEPGVSYSRTMNRSMKWVDEVRGTDSLREVARRIGTTHSTLARQVNNDQLTFETVREISRAYDRPVLADLITLGHLSTVDAGIEGVERALHSATDAQLVLEVSRRLDVAPSMLWDSPISEAVSRADATVHYPDFTREPDADDNYDHRAVAHDESLDRGEDSDY